MLLSQHIIGNVTKNSDNSIQLEPINDASAVTFYEGIYHVWHQCCQVRANIFQSLGARPGSPHAAALPG
eukprot:SAG11_NODE_2842_length_2915_cov_9.258523_3_plen_69_part_00